MKGDDLPSTRKIPALGSARQRWAALGSAGQRWAALWAALDSGTDPIYLVINLCCIDLKYDTQ